MISLKTLNAKDIGITHKNILKNYPWLQEEKYFGIGSYSVTKK